jgi:hypothetical protein
MAIERGSPKEGAVGEEGRLGTVETGRSADPSAMLKGLL